jgi:NACHT N-terminal Helical domain 1
MPLTTALIFTIGPSIAKALLKMLLKDQALLGDIAPDMLDLLRDKAMTARAQRKESQQIDMIAETVAAHLQPIFAEGRLDAGERSALLYEFVLTLDQSEIDAAQVIEARLDRVRLARGIFAARPEAIRTLSAAAAATYERMIREASEAITAIASEMLGYASLRDAALLQEQEQILQHITTLLSRPDEASARFESKYRGIIEHELNKLELFGVRRLTAAAKRQPLRVHKRIT